jgi:hypothetical protein
MGVGAAGFSDTFYDHRSSISVSTSGRLIPRGQRELSLRRFFAVTPKGNQYNPTEPEARFYELSFVEQIIRKNTTTWSYLTVHKSAHAIRILLNTLFTVIARVICMRPGNSREVKPKSYSRPRDLSQHIILGTISQEI